MSSQIKSISSNTVSIKPKKSYVDLFNKNYTCIKNKVNFIEDEKKQIKTSLEHIKNQNVFKTGKEKILDKVDTNVVEQDQSIIKKIPPFIFRPELNSLRSSKQTYFIENSRFNTKNQKYKNFYTKKKEKSFKFNSRNLNEKKITVFSLNKTKFQMMNSLKAIFFKISIIKIYLKNIIKCGVFLRKFINNKYKRGVFIKNLRKKGFLASKFDVSQIFDLKTKKQEKVSNLEKLRVEKMLKLKLETQIIQNLNPINFKNSDEKNKN